MNSGENTDDQITAAGFLIRLWEERIFLVFVIALCVFMAGGYILLSPSKYSATALLGHVTSVESSDQTSSSVGAALSLFGGGRPTDSKFEMFLTVIKTEEFSKYLEQKYHYVGHDHDGYTVKSKKELLTLLRSIASIPDLESNTTELTLQMSSQTFAPHFLLTVINEGNLAVRRLDIQRAEKLSSYVEGRFRSESNGALRDALVSLLISQERFLMMTKVDLPYAAQLLDGPVVSDRPTSPKKGLLVGIGLVVGLSLGLVSILLWDAVITERRSRGYGTMGLSEALCTFAGWIMSIFGGLHRDRGF